MPGERNKARRWFQFGIRDLLLLALAVGLACGWWLERSRLLEALNYEREKYEFVTVERDKLKSEVESRYLRLRNKRRLEFERLQPWRIEEGMKADELKRLRLEPRS